MSYDNILFIEAVGDACAEAARARDNWPPMYSAHEGYALLMEEFRELETHVFTKQKNRDLTAMRNEAIQIASIALCFAAEVCDEDRGRR